MKTRQLRKRTRKKTRAAVRVREHKPYGPGKKIALFMGIVIAFSVGPAAGLWTSNYAKASFLRFFESFREEIVNQLPGAYTALPELRSMDAFCESPIADERFKQTLCSPFRSAERAHLSAVIALVLMPVVPCLLSLAVVFIRLRNSGRAGLSSVALWTILKLANKIVALEALPFAFAMGFSIAALRHTRFPRLPDFTAPIASIVVSAVLYTVKAALVESYTQGFIELEAEPPEPELNNAAGA